MSKDFYHIIRFEDSTILVIAKSWNRPEFFLEKLSSELPKNEKHSTVIFDFLIKNGLNDRFYSSNFDSSRSRFVDFQKINAVDSIKLKANKFFHDNPKLLQHSTLTRAQKYLFKRELAL